VNKGERQIKRRITNGAFEHIGELREPDCVDALPGRSRQRYAPGGMPLAFTDEFRKDSQKQTQWRAFVRKAKPEDVSVDIDAVICHVAAFLMPVLEAARGAEPFELLLQQKGPWGQMTKG